MSNEVKSHDMVVTVNYAEGDEAAQALALKLTNELADVIYKPEYEAIHARVVRG